MVGQALPKEVRRLFAQSHVDPKLNARKLKPAELIALIDAGGVDQVFGATWFRPGEAIFSNAEVAEYTRLSRAHLRSGERRPPRSRCRGQGARALRQGRGLQGLEDRTLAMELAPTDAHYWPLFVKCIELDVPFLAQLGHTGPLCPSEVGR